jgi:ssDNA-binding Zn-finger/Zn-ribbon topoisomerase 1
MASAPYQLTSDEFSTITDHAWAGETCPKCQDLLQHIQQDEKGNAYIYPTGEQAEHMQELFGYEAAPTSAGTGYLDPEDPQWQKSVEHIQTRQKTPGGVGTFGPQSGMTRGEPTRDEWQVTSYLDSLGVEYIHKMKLEDIDPTESRAKIEYDIYIPTYLMAIETSPGWHEGGSSAGSFPQVIENDRYKKNFAKEHGIDLMVFDPAHGTEHFINNELAPRLLAVGVEAYQVSEPKSEDVVSEHQWNQPMGGAPAYQEEEWTPWPKRPQWLDEPVVCPYCDYVFPKDKGNLLNQINEHQKLKHPEIFPKPVKPVKPTKVLPPTQQPQQPTQTGPEKYPWYLPPAETPQTAPEGKPLPRVLKVQTTIPETQTTVPDPQAGTTIPETPQPDFWMSPYQEERGKKLLKEMMDEVDKEWELSQQKGSGLDQSQNTPRFPERGKVNDTIQDFSGQKGYAADSWAFAEEDHEYENDPENPGLCYYCGKQRNNRQAHPQKEEDHTHPCPECGTEMDAVNMARTWYRCPNWKGGCPNADTGVEAITCPKCYNKFMKQDQTDKGNPFSQSAMIYRHVGEEEGFTTPKFSFTHDQIQKISDEVDAGCDICSFVYNQLTTDEDVDDISQASSAHIEWDTKANFGMNMLDSDEIEHLNSLLGLSGTEIKSEEEDKERLYWCGDCGSLFDEKPALNLHMTRTGHKDPMEGTTEKYEDHFNGGAEGGPIGDFYPDNQNQNAGRGSESPMQTNYGY